MCSRSYSWLFLLFRFASMCIEERLFNLAFIIYTFVQLLIAGRGRPVNLLITVSRELAYLWTNSENLSICQNCLDDIVHLMELVTQAFMTPPPTIPI